MSQPSSSPSPLQGRGVPVRTGCAITLVCIAKLFRLSPYAKGRGLRGGVSKNERRADSSYRDCRPESRTRRGDNRWAILHYRTRCCNRAKLLAPTSRHSLRSNKSRSEEVILCLLLHRPANTGFKVSRRTDVSGNRERKYISRICYSSPQHHQRRQNANWELRKFSRLQPRRPRLQRGRSRHLFQ